MSRYDLPWLRYDNPVHKKIVLTLGSLGLYSDDIDIIKLANDLQLTIIDNRLSCSDSTIIEYVKAGCNLVENTTPEKLQKTAKNTSSKKSAVKKDIKPEKTISAAKKENNTPEKIEKRGRPLKNDIQSHKIRNILLKEKNSDSFLLVSPEKTNCDVITDDIYLDCLKETIKTVCEQFYTDYPDKVKKHPSIWFRFLCNTIKKNSPKISDISNYTLISNIWDLYSELCLSVGINRTIENFQIFTGLNWNVIEKIKKGSNPDCIELSKKIYSDCRGDLVGGLNTSFGSSPNQMFIAKSVYGLTENTIITHVSNNDNTKTIDDIPIFIEKKD